jgi:hypothetical protein
LSFTSGRGVVLSTCSKVAKVFCRSAGFN